MYIYNQRQHNLEKCVNNECFYSSTIGIDNGGKIDKILPHKSAFSTHWVLVLLQSLASISPDTVGSSRVSGNFIVVLLVLLLDDVDDFVFWLTMMMMMQHYLALLFNAAAGVARPPANGSKICAGCS